MNRPTVFRDALGWPNELRAGNTTKNIKASEQFIEWYRRSGGRYWSHSEKILPGEYSDDTQMILAVARSIISGNWKSALMNKELPFWLEYERGGGNALKESARMLKNRVVPWKSNENRRYFMAGGNGAAMRILPHVISATKNQDLDILISDIIRDSIYTHGHPRAILGASSYAFALHYLMNKNTVLEYGELVKAVIDGAKYWNKLEQNVLPEEWLILAEKHSGFDYQYIWSNTVSSMIEKLEFIGDSLNKGLLVNDTAVLKHLGCFDEANGAGDVAFLSSIFLASKYANNPVLGIKTAAYSVGADTDTIASMTGGLLGMLCGTSWIPPKWKLLQDYDCFGNIAEILLANNMIEASKQITNQYKDQQNDWKDSPIGKIRVLATAVVSSGKSTSVIIEKNETMLGQTLYFKKFQRNERTSFPTNREQEEMVQVISNQPMAEHATLSFDLKSIHELMDNPLLARLTFKKVLQIIEAFMNGNLDVVAVADKLKIEKGVAEIIKSHLNKSF